MMTKDNLRKLTGDERLGQMRDSEYLGAEDIDDDVEPVLTIDALWNGMVTLQRGKENKDVLSFKEERVPGIMLQVRPLIINSTNRKTLRKLFGDAKADTLVGKQIQLYIDHKVRDPQDGGFTDGIRIRPFKPRVKEQTVPPCADCGGTIEAAMGKDPRWLAAYTAKHYGVSLCAACAQKRKEAAAAEQPEAESAPENAGETEEVL